MSTGSPDEKQRLVIMAMRGQGRNELDLSGLGCWWNVGVNEREEIKRKFQRIRKRNVEKSFIEKKSTDRKAQKVVRGRQWVHLGPVEFGLPLKHLKSVILKRKSKPEVWETPAWRSESTPTRHMSYRLELKSPNNNLNTQLEKVRLQLRAHIDTLHLKTVKITRWGNPCFIADDAQEPGILLRAPGLSPGFTWALTKVYSFLAWIYQRPAQGVM